MKKKLTIVFSILIVLLLLAAGNTHRILPAENDPCQTDISHKGHVNELAMFHCIGHTEYEVNYEADGLLRVKKWNHLHPWMTLDWHLKQGFTREHAIQLIEKSKK